MYRFLAAAVEDLGDDGDDHHGLFVATISPGSPPAHRLIAYTTGFLSDDNDWIFGVILCLAGSISLNLGKINS